MQDQKVLSVLQSGLEEKFYSIPCVSTTFNTGYIETASILTGLACALESLKNGPVLWPQITGVSTIDSRNLTAVPEYLLALASTDLGYNYAIIFRTGQFVHP
jgi:hypothetical protein